MVTRLCTSSSGPCWPLPLMDSQCSSAQEEIAVMPLKPSLIGIPLGLETTTSSATSKDLILKQGHMALCPYMIRNMPAHASLHASAHPHSTAGNVICLDMHVSCVVTFVLHHLYTTLFGGWLTHDWPITQPHASHVLDSGCSYLRLHVSA